MKKLIITLVLVVCSFQVCFTQNIDQATVTKIKVKLINAEKLYQQGEYWDTLDKIKEIEAISGGMKSAKIQNLKVKAYLGAKMFQQSKDELNKLYKMNPDDDVIEDIASYESKIDGGIKEEKARKERARLAEIERKEQARLAEIRRIEEAKKAEIRRKEEERLAEIKRKEEERIAKTKRLEKERKLMEEKEWADAIENARFQESIKAITSLYRIRFKDKFGFIDEENKIVIPIKYDFVGSFFNNKLCVVQLNEKYGCINTKGDVVVPIIYDSMNHFSNESYDNFMIVQKNGKSAVIDINDNNKIVIPFKYEKLYSMDFTMVMAINNEKKGVLNRQGKEIVPIKYDAINGFTGVLYDKNKEVMQTVTYNENGKILRIQDENFDYQGKFNFGYAIVKKGNKYGIVDREGNIKVPIEHDEIEYLENGLYRVEIIDSNSKKLYGVITGNGDLFLPYEYTYIGSFKYGWTNFCKKNHGCGYIDTNGKVIGDGSYYTVREPENDRAVTSISINKNKNYGVIDNHGSVIIPFKYESINTIKQEFGWGCGDEGCKFQNYFLVQKDGLYGIFDRFGKSIIKIKYDNIEEVINGGWNDRYQPIYFKVTKNKLKGVFDSNGNMIVPIKYNKIELERPYNIDFSQFYLYDKNEKIANKFDLEYDEKGLQQKEFILKKR